MMYLPSSFTIERIRALFKRRIGDADLAYLGDTHGSGARVDVPGKPGYVYVHFPTGGYDENGNAIYGPPTMAYTGGAAYVNTPGMPVYVGYGYSGELEIKQAHAEGLRQAGVDARVLNPLNQQSKFVYLWQLTMGLASAVSTALTSSFLVTVKSFRHYVGNTFQTFETPFEADKIDLSSYVPGVDEHRYAAVWLDTYTNLPVVTTSTAQALSVDMDLTDIQELVVNRPADAIPLNAFYLSNNQDAIRKSDRDSDLRQVLNTPHLWGFPNVLAHLERVWPNRTLVTGPYTTTGVGAVTLESGAQIIIVHKNNFTATTAPTMSDDTGDGYSIGSLWFNATTNLLYVATTVTLGAAVWEAIEGVEGGGITQLTGDVTAGPGVGSQVATLATVNADVGAFTNASLTVNAKGLITAAASGATPALSTATYLIKTADVGLPNAQVMGALTTGLVKNTTTTGVQTIAVAGTDYTSPTGTENLSNKTITASTLDSTPIGATTPSTGAFTNTTITTALAVGGVAVNTNFPILLSKTFVPTGAENIQGMRIIPQVVPTTSTTASLYGANITPGFGGTGNISLLTGIQSGATTYGSGNVGTIQGGFFAVSNSGTGAATTVYGGQFSAVQQAPSTGSVWTNVYGGYAEVGISGATANGSMTNAHALYARVFDTGTGTITNAYGLRIATVTVGTGSNHALYTESGLNRLGDQLSVLGSADRIQNIVRGHSTQTTNIRETQTSTGAVLESVSGSGAAVHTVIDTATNTVTNGLTLRHNTTGIVAAGLGAGILTTLESSATENRSASLIETVWNTATDSAAVPDLNLVAYHNAAGTLTRRVGFTVRGGASATEWAIAGGTVAATATVTGSRGGNAALASLLTELAAKGVIIDGSSA